MTNKDFFMAVAESAFAASAICVLLTAAIAFAL